MKLSTLALAGFAAIAPLNSAKAEIFTDAEIKTAFDQVCKNHPVPNECLDHAPVGTLENQLVANRCDTFVTKAKTLLAQRDRKGAQSAYLDAMECGYGIANSAEAGDTALSSTAMTYGMNQRAMAERLTVRKNQGLAATVK